MAGSRDLRDPGIVVESVARRWTMIVSRYRSSAGSRYTYPRVSECFEDAVRRRTRQPDLLGDFGNSGAVTLIECGQRIEGRGRVLLLVGSIPWINLVVVYESDEVRSLANCLCRSANGLGSKTHVFVCVKGILDASLRSPGALPEVIPTLLVIITASFSSFDGRRVDLSTRSRRCRLKVPRESQCGLRTRSADCHSVLQVLACVGAWPTSVRPSSSVISSVTDLIAQGLPVSSALGITAIALAILIGIPLGIAAAVWKQTPADGRNHESRCVGDCAARVCDRTAARSHFRSVICTGCPLQVGKTARPVTSFFPWSLSPLPVIAYVARLTRSSLLDVVSSAFHSHRAGARRGALGILWGHALRPACFPVVSYTSARPPHCCHGFVGWLRRCSAAQARDAISSAGCDQP